MAVNDDSEAFYDAVPILRGFRTLMDPARYVPIPDDWSTGVADVVESTKAIAENRYKAVNMAGAAVIASVANALGSREFPSAFGGDGASFAISPCDREHAHGALAATAAWAAGELGLNLRVALMPVAEISAQGSFLIMHFGIRIGNFVPATYLRQVVENSDFRKYDDGLRMVIDCTADLAEALDRRLAAASKIANYGLHRQEAAIMTCFTPSAVRVDHVHFIDGAQGGYTASATALKASRSVMS